MNIEKIIIENFKGLKKIELGPIKPINILIGHNNCGKSSILECLDFFCKHLKVEEKIFQMRYGLSGERPSNSLPENVFNLGKEPILITVQIGLENLTDRENILCKSVDDWNKKYDRPKMSMDVANDLIKVEFLSNLSYQFEAKSYQSGLALSEVYTTFSSKSLGFENQKIILGKGDIRNLKINSVKALLQGGRHITTDDTLITEEE
jgi:energy-coupling factor transporter ATP-binding protein EcfA2